MEAPYGFGSCAKPGDVQSSAAAPAAMATVSRFSISFSTVGPGGHRRVDVFLRDGAAGADDAFRQVLRDGPILGAFGAERIRDRVVALMAFIRQQLVPRRRHE